MNTKIYKSKFTKVLLATSLMAGTLLPFASTVNAKTDTNGRTEYYAMVKKSSNADRATSDEYLALGAECTATVDIKGNKGKSNFRSSMKNSVKLKGTAGTKTGNDICTYAQKYLGYTINYDKANGGVMFFTKQFSGTVNRQGYKRIYTVYVTNSKLRAKYQKLGLLRKGDKDMKVIFTVNIKNPKLMKKPEYKITKSYSRTSSISSKNVVMNNVSYDDGSDTITVKGLKKGTRLNIYNGSGQLYKSVKVNSTSYKVTVPRDKDLTTEFKSEDATSSKTTDKIMLSRTEPNKFESYRLQYKIPEEKSSNVTPSGLKGSDIREFGTLGASISVVNTADVKQADIQFVSMVGKQDTIYRIYYGGNEVYKFTVNANEYNDYGDFYTYYKFYEDAETINKLSNLEPKNLADAKKYTITAQVEGKQESLHLPLYLSNDADEFVTGYVKYTD